MSANVDKRVVEMQFDNKQFERNVQTSCKSLDKLKECLNLDQSAKNLNNFQRAAHNFNLGSLFKAAEAITNKFSVLGTVGDQALRKITNAAINAGKQLQKVVNEYTLQPIKTGFAEYETQINAIQTILANTSDSMDKLGYSQQERLDIVNEKLDELNHYADKTIYNFTEMTRNIGTFTAAGVELDTAVASIQGIANLAAVSGSTSTQASTAMYQLSQAISSGTVKLQDWNSVVNAGMGGEVFQKALTRTARAMGVVGEEAQEAFNKMASGQMTFRDSLSSGWLTSDILTATLEQISWDFETMANSMGITVEQAKEMKKTDLLAAGYTLDEVDQIIALAETATDAATKVKTLTQLFDTLKEAIQSGWTQTWEYIIGDFGEAKEFLTSISDYFGDLINSSSEARNKVVKEWKDLGGRNSLINSFWNLIHAIQNVAGSVKEAFRKVFPPTTGKQLLNITQRFERFTESLRQFTENADYMSIIGSAIQVLGTGLKAVISALSAVGNLFAASFKIIKPFFAGILQMGSGIQTFTDGIKQSIAVSENFQEMLESLCKFGQRIKEAFKAQNLTDFWTQFKEGLQELNTTDEESKLSFTDRLKIMIDSLKNALKQWLAGVKDSAAETFAKAKAAFSSGIKMFAQGFSEWVSKIRGSVSDVLKKIKSYLKSKVGDFGDAFSGFLSNVKEFVQKSFAKVKAIDWSPLLNAAVGLSSIVKNAAIVKGMGAFRDLMKNMSGTITEVTKGLQLSTLFTEIIKSVTAFKNMMETLGKTLGETGSALQNLSKNGLKVTEIKKDSLGNTLLKIAASIGILVGSIWVLSKMDDADVMRGLGIIGTLAAGLLAASVLFSLVGAKSKVFLMAAGAVFLLALPIKMLAAMDVSQALKGMTGIGIILTELATFMRLAGKGFTGQTAFVSLGVAINLLVLAIKSLSKMNPEGLVKGLAGLGAMLTELALFNFISNGKQVEGMLGMAGAIMLLTLSFKSFGRMNVENIVKGLIGMGAALAELAAFNVLVSGKQVEGMLSMAGAVALLALAMKTIGKLNTGTIVKGVLGLGGVMTAFGAMVKMSGDLKVGNSLVLLLSLGGSMLMLAALFKQFEEFDGDKLLKSALSISGVMLAIGAVMKILSGIPFLGALKASANFAVFATVLTGVVAGITGVLNAIDEEWGGMETSLQTGGELLGLVGEAIGRFFGGIGSGFMTGLNLPGLGTALSDFMANAEGFITGVQGIDSSASTKVGYLTDAIGSITSAGFWASIKSAIAGEDTAERAITGFVAIGQGLNAYAALISDMPGASSFARVVTSTTMAKTLADTLKVLSKTPYGSAANFAAELESVGAGLVNFSGQIKGIGSGGDFATMDDFKAAKMAAEGLADLNNSLPSTGGKLQDWFGSPDLGKFADNISTIGSALQGYATSITGIGLLASSSDLDKAEDIATALVGILTSLPETGGKLQEWLGENDMVAFSDGIAALAGGLISYAENIKGIAGAADAADFDRAGDIASSLSDLENSLPRTGGKLQEWIGWPDLEKFSTNIVTLAEGLVAYSKTIQGINQLAGEEDFTRAAETATGLAELERSLSLTGGSFLKWLVGEQELDKFAENVKLLGEGLEAYTNSISGVDASKSQEAITVMQSIQELIGSLDKSGSVWENLGNMFGKGSSVNTLVTYMTAMEQAGGNLSAFSTSVDTVNTDKVSTALAAMQMFIDFVNGISTTSVVESAWNKYFVDGDQLSSLNKMVSSLAGMGAAFKSFSDGTANIDEDMARLTAIETFFVSVKTLSESIKEMGKLDISPVQKLLDNYSQLTIPAFDTEGMAAANAYLSSLNEGIQNGGETLTIVVVALSSAGIQAAESTYSEWFSAGQYWGMGLVDGLSNMSAAVQAEAGRVATNAVSRVNSAWEIGSPSKVAERLAMFFDLGLANGFTRYANTVSQSAENMSEGAVESAKTMMRGINTSIFDYIDPNPTIRPVLDLTNVRNGASSISGMFSNNQMLGTDMFSGMRFARGVNDLSFEGARLSGSFDNKDVVAELQTLSDRFDNLSEAVTNMKMVLDTGELVGRTSAKIDSQLGTLDMRRRRGN